jgi:hypothetical protein
MISDIFVTRNYEKLKKMALKELSFLSSKDVCEDIFHDTLIKCVEQMKLGKITEEDFILYFAKSIKINGWRELKYATNALRSDDECDFGELEEYSVEMNISNIDYELILNEIEKHFNSEYKLIFKMWSENYTVKEINEYLNINNSRYIIDKLKVWVKKKYTN